MRFVVAAAALACLLIVACSSSPSAPESIVCFDVNKGCTCSHQAGGSSSQTKSCNASVLPDLPDTACCADPGWPSSGSCDCLTSAIFCGVVPGYEQATDGGAGEDACVCSSDPYPQQTIGPTCYSNGTTIPGAGLGTCCMFSANAAGALGVPACLCAAGLHTCGTGGTPVNECSSASFPAPSSSCPHGTTLVASCL
jgi:hypothetical protein